MARVSFLDAALRKASYILREEGPLVLADRAARAGIVKVRRALRDDSANVARWQALKGKYAGKRAFLIGNGPSLNRTPLHLLAGEHTMCFNWFTLMYERLSWRPTFYTTIDDRVLQDLAPQMDGVLSEVQYGFLPDLHPYNIDFTRLVAQRENLYWLQLDRLHFSDDLPWCGINKTVANVGLQVLAYLGFREIYLLGVDMSYAPHAGLAHESKRDVTAQADNDPNHFDPRYFGAGRRYHAPRMDETLEKFIEGKAFFDARGVKVMNAGVGGVLEVFPRVAFRSLFTADAREELALLLRPTGVTPVGTTLGETFPGAVRVAPGARWPAGAPIVICEAEDGAGRIGTQVFEYVPYGPFGGEYLFLART